MTLSVAIQLSPWFRRAILATVTFALLLSVTVFVESRFLGDALFIGGLVAAFNCHVLCESRRDLLVLLRPSVVVINYLLLSMTLGALAFHIDAIVLPSMTEGVRYWDNAFVTRLFLGIFVLAVVAGHDYRGKAVAIVLPYAGPIKVAAMAGFIVMLGGVLESVGFGFAGEVAAAGVAVVAVHVARWESAKARWLVYSIVVIVLAIVFAQSKRNAIFLLYPILMLEAMRSSDRRLTLEVARRLAVLGAGTLVLILLATAWRTRELLLIDSVLALPVAAFTYAQDDRFLGFFLLNIEATYTYFHASNAIEYSIAGLIPEQWGSTYLKAVLIGLPRSIVAWKPFSAVHYYTSAFDPLFRDIGGSWVVSMLGEAFMNFHLFGSVVAAFILRVADSAVIRIGTRGFRDNIVVAALAFYFPVACLVYARGSGFDLALVQVLVVVVAAVPWMLVVRYRSPDTFAGTPARASPSSV